MLTADLNMQSHKYTQHILTVYRLNWTELSKAQIGWKTYINLSKCFHRVDSTVFITAAWSILSHSSWSPYSVPSPIYINTWVYEGWSISNEKNTQEISSHQNCLIIFKCTSFGDQHTFPIFASLLLHYHRKIFDLALQSAHLWQWQLRRPQKHTHRMIWTFGNPMESDLQNKVDERGVRRLTHA